MTVDPMTTPMPSARNTATIETMWYRRFTMPRCSPVSSAARKGVPGLPQAEPRDAYEHMERLGNRDDDEHGEERGADEERKVALADPALVQAVHALRVHEHRPHLETHEKCRRHPLAAFVQKLDHRRVGAHGDDQLGALL